MLYLEFIDWPDYIELLLAESLPLTRLDILDASTPGHYQFHLVASMPCPKAGVLAICSVLIYDTAEPDFSARPDDEAARPEFFEGLRVTLTKAKAEVALVFKKARLRVRPGLYSIEPPPILKLRK